MVAFDDAQNVTQEFARNRIPLSDFSRASTAQELAYNNQLIEIYGTPYPQDIGPGGFYPQGYTGPDLEYPDYMYVDGAGHQHLWGKPPNPTTFSTNYLFIGQIPTNWLANVYNNFDFYTNNNYNPTGPDTNFVSLYPRAGWVHQTPWLDRASESRRGASKRR